MPELPEVETIARQLQHVLRGRVVKGVEVLREKSFTGEANRLIGKPVRRISRKAKNIIVEFEQSEMVALIHLKMTGQLIFQPQAYGLKLQAKRVVGGHPTDDWIQTLPSKHTRVIIRFTDGSTLFFNDQRVFGWIKVMKISDFRSQILDKLPPDVVDPEFTVTYLTNVLKRSTRPVKLVLLDQSKIGGLGNIYVNDALWLAGTNPTRRANTLSSREIKRLHAASIQVILRGIQTGGASESTYKHIDGMGGTYQREYLVYKREMKVCGRKGCIGVIEKIRLGGRGTYVCSTCQK